ncbi:MAG TPA: heterodisulfide reductase-related iron-sulfur binding cluster, partial [Bacteroidales bacterium]|nr:heterodisulfide reductase-related iron-sulfur binding cluster [Bacteroidales bacterium]
IYEQPRILLDKVSRLLHPAKEKEEALCCGGSLASFNLSSAQRNIIRDDALAVLLQPNPDKLITSCPLCKKTFSRGTKVQVEDIAELIASSAYVPQKKKTGIKPETEIISVY